MITKQLISNRIHKAVPRILQKYPLLKKILHDLYAQTGTVLLVGGGVRDILRDQPFTDLDFEVYGIELAKLTEILQKHAPVHLVGKSFGVLKMPSIQADWSLPRIDGSGRKPEVHTDPHLSYQQAFKRRDLTINAMGINMHTLELIDPYDGVLSLQKGILDAPDPDFFKEDPLRVLRVMQFAARFNMHVSETLSSICRQVSLKNISRERKEEEFFKLFTKSSDPTQGLQWLQSINAWNSNVPACSQHETLYASITSIAKNRHLTTYQKAYLSWSALFYFADIPHDHHKILQQNIAQYIQANETKVYISNLVWHAHHLPSPITPATMAWLAHLVYPHAQIYDLIQLLHSINPQRAQTIESASTQAGVLHAPIPPLLTGKDLVHLVQGKALGSAVNQAYKHQIMQHVTDKKALLQHMANILQTL